MKNLKKISKENYWEFNGIKIIISRRARIKKQVGIESSNMAF